MKNIIITIILSHFLINSLSAQVYSFQSQGTAIDLEIVTNDCVNFNYEIKVDGIIPTMDCYATLQGYNSSNNTYCGFIPFTAGCYDPGSVTFPQPAHIYNNQNWSTKQWEAVYAVPEVGPSSQPLQSPYCLWLVDEAVVIQQYERRVSCDNIGAKVNFFEPYDLGCKSIASITTSHQSGDYFPCGCTNVTGTINYTDGTTYDFDFYVEVDGCDPNSPTLAIIEGGLLLESVPQSTSNGDVLTINSCGLVSKSNLSTLDMDSDPANEIQDISTDATAGNITLSSGSSLTLNVDDADNDPMNELQDWSNLPNIPADILDGDQVDDADNDPANEIQDISLNGADLTITSGSTITLPSGSSLIDMDNDTHVDVEDTPDNDEINFTMQGIENYRFRNNNGNAIMDIRNSSNTIIGTDAGLNIATSGNSSTFIGKNAGKSNTSGDSNTFIGENAGESNQAGKNNVAIGSESLKNATSNSNVAVGQNSGANTTTGLNNVFVGEASGYTNDTGINNVIIGQGAGYNNDASYNTYVGRWSGLQNFTGTYNTALGYSSGSANGQAGLTNSTAIGHDARATASNMVRLGNSAVTKITGNVDFTFPSDMRIKTNIENSQMGLDFINELRPVKYKVDYNKMAKMQGENLEDFKKERNELSNKINHGFLAQEVEAILQKSGLEFQGVVVPEDKDSDLYRMSYSTFVVPLVKAVQELDEENKSLKVENQKLQNQISSIIRRLETLEQQ